MKRMAIISSTNYIDWPMGGMLSFLRDLIPHLSRYFEIELWGVSTGRKPPANIYIGKKNFKIYYFGQIKTGRRKIIPNLVKVVWDIFAFKKIILNRKYDILYFHGIPLEIPFLKRKRKVKIISHIHGVGNNPFLFLGPRPTRKPIAAIYELYRRFLIKRSDLTIISSDERRYLEFTNLLSPTLIAKTVRAMPFADTDLFHPLPQSMVRKKLSIPEEIKVIVATMRLVPEKDPLLLIEVYKELKKILNISSLMFIFGDGPLKKKIEEKIREEKLQDEILMKGFRPREELKEWLNAADVFLFTSSGEGLPLSLIEALLCGLPIVTPDIPGVHDLVENGRNGYIVSSREPREIALYLRKALGKSNLMREMAIEKSKEFTPEKAAEKIAKEIYRLWE